MAPEISSPPRLVNIHTTQQLVVRDDDHVDDDLTTSLTKALARNDDPTLPLSPRSGNTNTLSSTSSSTSSVTETQPANATAASHQLVLASPYADMDGGDDDSSRSVSKTMAVTVTVLSLHGLVAKPPKPVT